MHRHTTQVFIVVFFEQQHPPQRRLCQIEGNQRLLAPPASQFLLRNRCWHIAERLDSNRNRDLSRQHMHEAAFDRVERSPQHRIALHHPAAGGDERFPIQRAEQFHRQ